MRRILRLIAAIIGLPALLLIFAAEKLTDWADEMESLTRRPPPE